MGSLSQSGLTDTHPYSQGAKQLELQNNQIARLIAHLAEPLLRETGLLLRPIPYYERLDRVRAREEELIRSHGQVLVELKNTALNKILRTWAFVDELCQEVLRNFYPHLPGESELILRALWGAAVALDQLLDEEEIDPASLFPGGISATGHPTDAGETGHEHIFNAPLGMTVLLEPFTEYLREHVNSPAYEALHANLTIMLDAEVDSLGVTLGKSPDELVRRIVRDKSVLLSWVGFQACTLHEELDPTEALEYRQICDMLGEVLWILDDLVDLEEDLDRGVWNRTLWRIYDDIGPVRFQEVSTSKIQLAVEIKTNSWVDAEINAIHNRIALLVSHPSINNPEKLIEMMSFWVTLGLGIYG